MHEVLKVYCFIDYDNAPMHGTYNAVQNTQSSRMT